MKDIKLPRKRKKAFIKSNGKNEYITAVILGEVLFEGGRLNADRFYKLRQAKTKAEYRRSHNGMLIIGKW
jgi:hypothetical protein